MSRTAKARLEAIAPAIAARDAFIARAQFATPSELLKLAMEAIGMHLAANGLETVGHDGRVSVSMEDICASHCLKAVADAYERSRNAPSDILTRKIHAIKDRRAATGERLKEAKDYVEAHPELWSAA